MTRKITSAGQRSTKGRTSAKAKSQAKSPMGRKSATPAPTDFTPKKKLSRRGIESGSESKANRNMSGSRAHSRDVADSKLPQPGKRTRPRSDVDELRGAKRPGDR